MGRTYRIIFAFLFALVVISNTAEAQTNTVTSTVTGTTTVDRAPGTASAPSIVVNNQDVCTTATSYAVQTQILGFATGQTITDENCERLKLARSLYGMGMKVAAVSVLCQDERVFQGMLMAGTPCPYMGEIGSAAGAMWANDGRGYDPVINNLPEDVPGDSRPTVTVNEEQSNGKSGIAAILGILALLVFL